MEERGISGKGKRQEKEQGRRARREGKTGCRKEKRKRIDEESTGQELKEKRRRRWPADKRKEGKRQELDGTSQGTQKKTKEKEKA